MYAYTCIILDLMYMKSAAVSSFSVVREELDENVTTNISCKCETVYVSTLIIQSCEVHSVISPRTKINIKVSNTVIDFLKFH